MHRSTTASVAVSVLLFALALDCPAGPAHAFALDLREVETVATQHHRDPTSLVILRGRLEQEAADDPTCDRLLALARLWFITGSQASGSAAKLEAYARARDLGRRALALDSGSAAAQFWVTASTARWGHTQGVMQSLGLLGEVRRGIDRVLELDPRFTRGYALAGHFALELPPLLGGNAARAEEMFRKGLTLDPHFTSMRVGLAKSLLRQGRIDEARAELERTLAESTPTNEADWTLEDAPEARRHLELPALQTQPPAVRGGSRETPG
jgi:tetratricopeptide (TPR) repeat protein